MASARLIRQASHRGRSRQLAESNVPELEPLLDEDIEAENDASSDYVLRSRQPREPNRFADLPVYQNIWRIRREVIANIQDPYTLEQLRAPRLNTGVVRPLMDQLYNLQDISIVYCLLVNRVQFLHDQSYQAHYQSVSTSRAMLCEILALKILRQYDDDSSGKKGLLLLSNILIAGFEPFQGAPDGLASSRSRALKWAFQDRGGYERQMTSLEIAIISDSKLLLSSPACQKVVDAVYIGQIVYTPTSFIDILPDHYKHRSIRLYNPRQAPLLNQYRLNVPRTRNILEVCQFLILLCLFFLVMETRDPRRFSGEELVFCVYTFGWILDQLASMLEHGWRVYSQNLWTFLDVVFAFLFLTYFAVRMHGVRTGADDLNKPALDILAMSAPFLVPRLAFNLFSENLLFVSLRDMMSKFLVLTFLAVWCFTGFFLSMNWLSGGFHHPYTIGKWLVYIWFGLDGTGIQRSVEFHWLLGPILMISFAILGNTLFLTIVVATLSASYSTISKFSVAEIQFRRAVLTFEGVKSDAIFSYQPPFNLLALVVLLPLKLLLTPRWFHKVNVVAIRSVNSPILLIIGLYERHAQWLSSRVGAIPFARRTPRNRAATFGDLSRFHVHGDIQVVFQAPPPEGSAAQTRTYRNGESELTGKSTSRPRQDTAQRESSEAITWAIPRTGNSPQPRRKASLWSTDGFEARMAGLLQDHEESSGDAGDSNLPDRLKALEASTKRIEKLLAAMTTATATEVHEAPHAPDEDADSSKSMSL